MAVPLSFTESRSGWSSIRSLSLTRAIAGLGPQNIRTKTVAGNAVEILSEVSHSGVVDLLPINPDRLLPGAGNDRKCTGP